MKSESVKHVVVKRFNFDKFIELFCGYCLLTIPAFLVGYFSRPIRGWALEQIVWTFMVTLWFVVGATMAQELAEEQPKEVIVHEKR